MGLPRISWSTFGFLDFILVPSPAARITETFIKHLFLFTYYIITKLSYYIQENSRIYLILKIFSVKIIFKPNFYVNHLKVNKFYHSLTKYFFDSIVNTYWWGDKNEKL